MIKADYVPVSIVVHMHEGALIHNADHDLFRRRYTGKKIHMSRTYRVTPVPLKK